MSRDLSVRNACPLQEEITRLHLHIKFNKRHLDLIGRSKAENLGEDGSVDSDKAAQGSCGEYSDSEGQQTDAECQTQSDDEDDDNDCLGDDSAGAAPQGTKSRPASQFLLPHILSSFHQAVQILAGFNFGSSVRVRV